MHCCLRVPELLRAICQQANDPSSKNLSDLVTLAVTCKAFKEPALDVLYYELRYFAHLFMCLPRDLWTLKRDKKSGALVRSTLSFRRAMVRDDWLVLQAYRCRVRVICLNKASKGVSVDPDALSMVRSFSGDVLLPNLHRYKLRNSDWEFDDYVPFQRGIMHFPELFFGPNLTKLDLGRLESRSLHVLSALSRTSPLLERLILSVHNAVNDPLLGNKLLEALEDVARNLKRIRNLQLDLVDGTSIPVVPVVSVLATLPSLDFLSLGCHDLSLSFPSACPCVGTDTIMFPQLTGLKLGGNACQIAHLIHSLHSLPCLKKIELYFKCCEEDIAVPQVVAFMATWLFDAASPIQDIKLTFLEQFSPDLLLFEDLRPLFRFKGLKRFCISPCPHPAYDDHQLSELSNAFVNLDRLSLQWRSDAVHHVSDTNVTLSGLISLLRSCPKLRELSLAIDVTQSCAPQIRSEIEASIADFCHTSLTKWEVLDSLLEKDDVQYVSRTLACLVPHLLHIVPPTEETTMFNSKFLDEAVEIWRNVDTQLEFCRVARKNYLRHVFVTQALVGQEEVSNFVVQHGGD